MTCQPGLRHNWGVLFPWSWITVLLVLNLSLQVWDGLTTYYGLSLGVQEGNPLLQSCMGYLGNAMTLLAAKSAACLLLVYLHHVASLVVSQWGLVLTAFSYFVFSFLPWIILFLS